MMKNNKKKGFTIVELVIVIAVIAILAAVLIPTFSNVVEKANKSAALQAAKNAHTEALAEFYEDGVLENYVDEVPGAFNSSAAGACTESHDHTKACAGWEGYQAAKGDRYVDAATGLVFKVAGGEVVLEQAIYGDYTVSINADGTVKVEKTA